MESACFTFLIIDCYASLSRDARFVATNYYETMFRAVEAARG